MLDDFIATAAVLIVAAALLAGLSRRWVAEERRIVVFGFLAHVVGVFVQVFVIEQIYGGSSDIAGYYRSGVELASALRKDFQFIFPEAFKIFVHDDTANLPFAVFGGAGSTGSLTVLSSLLFLVLGDSLYGAAMATALFAFFGKLAIFLAISPGFARAHRQRVLLATLLVPSVVFWSSTIAKEAVSVGFLGLALLLLRSFLDGRFKPSRLLLAAFCLTPVALIKPYVLLCFTVAFAVWLYLERGLRLGRHFVIRPSTALVALLLMTGGVIVLGKLAPRIAVENLAKSTSAVQAAGVNVEGGSNYQLREPVPEQEEDSGVQSQLLLAPIALPTALFRPFIFEVRNPMMLLNALETTALLFLTIRVLFRGGLVRVRDAIAGNPTLVFSLLFSLILGTAVGLASTNLGSLSRYRMPFMPFFVGLILVLDATFGPNSSSERPKHESVTSRLEGAQHT